VLLGRVARELTGMVASRDGPGALIDYLRGNQMTIVCGTDTITVGAEFFRATVIAAPTEKACVYTGRTQAADVGRQPLVHSAESERISSHSYTSQPSRATEGNDQHSRDTSHLTTADMT
jgi:hypothetical protein